CCGQRRAERRAGRACIFVSRGISIAAILMNIAMPCFNPTQEAIGGVRLPFLRNTRLDGAFHHYSTPPGRLRGRTLFHKHHHAWLQCKSGSHGSLPHRQASRPPTIYHHGQSQRCQKVLL
ncbi:hypothetical protein JB92DRAFT_2874847, partial [Gautieria morchelliformis]